MNSPWVYYNTSEEDIVLASQRINVSSRVHVRAKQIEQLVLAVKFSHWSSWKHRHHDIMLYRLFKKDFKQLLKTIYIFDLKALIQRRVSQEQAAHIISTNDCPNVSPTTETTSYYV